MRFFFFECFQVNDDRIEYILSLQCMYCMIFWCLFNNLGQFEPSSHIPLKSYTLKQYFKKPNRLKIE